MTHSLLFNAIAEALASGPRRSDRSDVNTARILARDLAADPDDVPPPQPVKPLVPAAVLVPLVLRDDGLTVLLTQRTAHLAHHAGQISFPGGRMEDGDASPEDTALRETAEEIGLSPDRVHIVGRLDDYVTVTHFRVTPVVGLIQPGFDLTLDAFEVADAFEVPLSFLINPANHQRHHRQTPDGLKRYFYAIPYQERYIWGATAGMLVNLSDVLRASAHFAALTNGLSA